MNLIRHGRFLTFIFLLLLLPGSASLYAEDISAELSRNVISAGEATVLKIMISGDTSNIRPLKMPSVKGLDISYTGASKSFRFINDNVWSGIILNFTIYAKKSGVYRIPPFVISAGGRELSTSGMELTVRESRPEGQSRNVFFLRGEVELSSDRILAGEPVVMRYYVLFSGDRAVRIEGFREQPELKGFILTEINEQIPPVFEEREGVTYEKIHSGTFLLTPAGAGDFTAGGGSLVITIDGGRGFFSFPDQKQINMPRRQIKVMPLPVRGAPSGFKGALGRFTIDAGLVKGESEVDDEINFPLTVEGKGNFLSLHDPAINGFDNAKVFITGESPEFNLADDTPEGMKRYNVTVIPEKPGEIKGYFSLPCYDPYSKEYKVVNTEPVTIQVRGGESFSREENAVRNTPENQDPFLLKVYAAAGSLILLALGAGIFLFKRDKRIISQINKNSKDGKRNTPGKIASEKVAEKENLFSELKDSMHNNDKEGFLRTAEKITGLQVSGSNAGKGIGEIKEKINLCRYGGAPLSSNDMNTIISAIEEELFSQGK